MEAFVFLLEGLGVAFRAEMLFATLVGVLLGLAVGVLPALGPAAAVALLLPVIVKFDPATAMAGLAGVYYGALYGGAVTSILLGLPGESASMMTMLDGYPLAKRGEAGRALGISIFASFIGGIVAIVLFTLVAAPFAEFAVRFGPAEMTALMIMALAFSTALGGNDIWKGLCALGLGLWIGTIGLDIVTGGPRFNFGSINLMEGVEFAVVAIGLFGLGEIFSSLSEEAEGSEKRQKYALRSLLPRIKDISVSRKHWSMGAIVGFVVGVLPGAGATASSIFAYSISKKIAKKPEEYGNGSIEGIAAPEAANSASSFSSMIPLFTLGIPGSGTTAIMLGGLLMLGVQPGPLLFKEQSEFIWGVIGTFYTGNLMLVVLTLLLIPVLATIVFIPKTILFPIITGVVLYGVYGINNSVFDIGVALFFGVLGFMFKRLDYPIVPVLLGVVLGPILEQGVRRSLIMSDGSFNIFFESPISLTMWVMVVSLIVWPVFKRLLRARAWPPLSD